MIWAETRYIGCAINDCGYYGIASTYRTIFVCLYYKAGNFIGSTPYNTSSTTQCDNCDDDRDNNCNSTDPLRDNLCAGGLSSSFENDKGTDIDVCDNGLGVTISNACNLNSITSEPTTAAPTTVNSTSQDVCNVSLKVVNDWPISKMDGWTLCLDEPYSHHIYPSCFSSCLTGDDYSLFVGAKENSTSQTFYVGAYGPSSVITTNTSSNSVAYLPSWREGYNVYWYYFPGMSFGFAPISNISLSSADTYDTSDIQRLSWHLGQSAGGWRAGDVTGLNDNDVWRKVVYYKASTACSTATTSEPTTAQPTTSSPTTANSTTQDVCDVCLNVVNDWPISRMNGWTLCYDEPYSDYTNQSSFSSCLTGDGYSLFVGAKENSTSEKFYIGAYGPSSVITTNTSNDSSAYLPSWHEGYNVYWYYYPGQSFGYAPIATVILDSADVYDFSDIQRLSWHTHFGADRGSFRVGGYRAGDIIGLNDDTVWRKVVYYKACSTASTSVPTACNPTTNSPTSSQPRTASPTSATPTTANPTTTEPTSASPTTAIPTTDTPTTSQPTTSSPTIGLYCKSI